MNHKPTFAAGLSFVGTCTLDKKRHKVYTVAARHSTWAVFCDSHDMRKRYNVAIDGTDEKEMAIVYDGDGLEYFLSSAVRFTGDLSKV